MPASFHDPKSPVALGALTRYLSGLDLTTTKRGESYARGRRVVDLWEDDGVVAGSVQGTQREPYTSTLSWDGRRWSSECTCAAGVDCKHSYALGRTWLNRQAVRPTTGQVTITRITGKTKAEVTALGDKPSFRQEWSAKLAEKLGRPVNSDEGRLLGRLAALFSDLQAHDRIMPANIRAREFVVSREAAPSEWEPAFQGWWPPGQPPADPWALWQYLAYDYQRSGEAIPEILLVMTDTSAVRAAAESRLVQQELAHWRNALLTPPPIERYTQLQEAAEEAFELPADLRVLLQSDGKARLEVQAQAGKTWKAPTQKWLGQLTTAGLATFESLPPAARALGLLLRLENRSHDLRYQRVLACDLFARILAHPPALPAVVLADGTPFRIEPEPLRHHAVTDPADPARLNVTLVRPDGTPVPADLRPFLAEREPLYLLDHRVWRGPPPLPQRLPVAALSDPGLASALRSTGMTLPSELAAKFRTVELRPLLRCWLTDAAPGQGATTFNAQLFATSNEPLCSQHWSGFGGWQWTKGGTPPAARTDTPHYSFDLAAANAVGARFGAFGLQYSDWNAAWCRNATRTFPDDFVAWHATLPSGLAIEVSPDLQGLLGKPLRARVAVNLSPADASGQDWFDVTVQLQPEDTTLTPAEIELLVKARGGWVKLPQRGWQRLAVEDAISPEERAALDRLGLAADGEALSGRRTTHRYHALQLADVPVDDEELADRLRDRSAALRALPPPPLPAGLNAQLRPYQLEGYHFLSHLASQGLGGVLADDMGLGKTLQTLAWLLAMADKAKAEGRPFRALVVAPKSVVPNWAVEAGRFAPALTTARALPGSDLPDNVQLLVINYVQLRLRAPELSALEWDAVVLDEGQNIKNPGSATARAARALPARHRLVLTGTPIENRLLDLWSLMAFAQPGLLGSQPSFQRLYNDREDPAGARSRLATRVRPFLLRRTKGQVARDLPARIEEEIGCELEGSQRLLYEAELKRARQLLLKVGDARQFDAQRFNILQSLLRLRQICCDPRLIGHTAVDPVEQVAAKKRGRPAKKLAPSPLVAESAATTADGDDATGAVIDSTDEDAPARPSSAKLDALLDTVEPLVAEGHRVLVFSQFVSMLELIRTELAVRGIGHLLLTGQTENRQALVDKFQAADGPPVFLLSLKAAGSGLNLTAASYVILYDPWWNPAVEAQAIDRTHRIGQKSTVMAYRLIAKNTVEEKIRALQREKSELAAAVVQEESLATVMDLDSLRRILG